MSTTLETAAQPINQTVPTYREFYDQTFAWFEANGEAERAKKRQLAAFEKWGEKVVHAVLCADLATTFGNYHSFMASDMEKAVKNHPEAWEAASEKVSEFGFGMLCGMMYCALTGASLEPSTLTIDQLLDGRRERAAEYTAAEAEYEAEAAKRKATPDALQVA